MTNNLTTLRFTLESPDSNYGVHLDEQLQVEIHEGLWKVTNPSGHPSWIGYGRSKHEAIITYLYVRLGLNEASPVGA